MCTAGRRRVASMRLERVASSALRWTISGNLPRLWRRPGVGLLSCRRHPTGGRHGCDGSVFRRAGSGCSACGRMVAGTNNVRPVWKVSQKFDSSLHIRHSSGCVKEQDCSSSPPSFLPSPLVLSLLPFLVFYFVAHLRHCRM